MPTSCNLLSLAGYAPEETISNYDLTKIVDTSEEWIVERTGIRNRRRLPATENASDLGLRAAKAALEQANADPRSITHVIGATCTPDYLSPSIACIIAGQLDAGNAMAFDIGAACSGFIYGLDICRSVLAGAPEARILFVCSEALTRRVNWKDRSTCVLFGDAAAAAVLESGNAGRLCGLKDALCQSDGRQKDLIIVGGGTSCGYQTGQPVDEKFFLSMRGRDTYRHAVRQMAAVCEKILERNQLEIGDIDLLVPHQANMRIIEAVGGRLGMPAEKVFVNLANYGNTSAASIPLALAEAWEKGAIRPGFKVLATSFGAGLTWGAAILQF